MYPGFRRRLQFEKNRNEICLCLPVHERIFALNAIQKENVQEKQSGNPPELISPTRQIKTWNWIDFLLIFVVGGILIGLGGQIVIGIVTYVVTHSSAISQWLTIEGLVITEGAFIGSVLLVGFLGKHMNWITLGFRVLAKHWIFSTIGLAIGFRLLVVLAFFLAQQVFKQPVTLLQTQALLPPDLSWTGIICMVLLVGVIAPFAEELFFRGFLYTFLRERLGIWVGAAISALIFALFHFEPVVVAVTFLLGLACVFVYERSRSLWGNILLHSMYNLLGLLPAYIMLAASKHLPFFYAFPPRQGITS